MKRLIIFLIRRKLGVKVYEPFRFANQISPKNYYYFTETNLTKVIPTGSGKVEFNSNVSLNWILDDDCKIEKVK